jgi:hypothetical protein
MSLDASQLKENWVLMVGKVGHYCGLENTLSKKIIFN